MGLGLPSYQRKQFNKMNCELSTYAVQRDREGFQFGAKILAQGGL